MIGLPVVWSPMSSLLRVSDLNMLLVKVTVVLAVGWLIHALLVRSYPFLRVGLWRSVAIGTGLLVVLAVFPVGLELLVNPPLDQSIASVTAEFASCRRSMLPTSMPTAFWMRRWERSPLSGRLPPSTRQRPRLQHRV